MIQTDSALLIIDMQKGSFTPSTPRFDSAGVIERINQLAKHFRKEGKPVIFIQHDGAGSGSFEKNSEEWEILDELKKSQQDTYIDKYANDSFYHSSLQQVLEDLNISNLYITGCATDFCVESTVQSALTKDFNLFIISDAHTTADRPALTAKQVIKHYNWVWENMAPTRGRIHVRETSQIVSTLTEFASI